VIFEFIRAEKANYPVRLMCRVIGVSSSGFYSWLKDGSKREVKDRELLGIIKKVFGEFRETYGSPRIYDELKERDVSCGKARVERLMRENGLTPPRKQKYRVTTKSNPKHPVAENLLQRDFSASAPNQRWVSDVTYVWTWEGWLYLAVVLDLFSRRVVGWAMSSRMTTELLTLPALHMALAHREPDPGLIHHSDRGSQYTDSDYRKTLEAHGIECSMSRRGDCWDNAVNESFFATLKLDLVFRRSFRTRVEARSAIFEYIEVFYHRLRRHSYLGGLTPVDFERVIGLAA